MQADGWEPCPPLPWSVIVKSSQEDAISPRPMLFVAGENAHSIEFSEDAYRLAAEPKELMIIPGAGHVDLYDRTDLIPFEKITGFFKKSLEVK